MFKDFIKELFGFHICHFLHFDKNVQICSCGEYIVYDPETKKHIKGSATRLIRDRPDLIINYNIKKKYVIKNLRRGSQCNKPRPGGYEVLSTAWRKEVYEGETIQTFLSRTGEHFYSKGSNHEVHKDKLVRYVEEPVYMLEHNEIDKFIKIHTPCIFYDKGELYRDYGCLILI